MKLYIPKHLYGLTIIEQLAKLVSAYQGQRKDSDLEGVMKNTDPVRKFIMMRIDPDQSIFIAGSQNYADVVNYLTALFYSVKGTQKVLEYMKKYLGFQDKEIIYDAKTISIFPTGVSLGDETLYYDTLGGFLSELLYFEDFKTDIGSTKLLINHKVVSRIHADADVHCYKKITIIQQS